MALTADQVLQLLYDAGVTDHAGLTAWLATAKAESSLNPSVVNSIGATGLFQINQPVWAKQYPTWTKAWLQDPTNNVAAAKIVSKGWTSRSPWVSSAFGQAANTPSSSLQATTFLQSPLERAGQAAIETAAPAINSLDTINSFMSALTQPGTWLRVGYAVVGILLIAGAVSALGEKTLANSDTAKLVKGLT